MEKDGLVGAKTPEFVIYGVFQTCYTDHFCESSQNNRKQEDWKLPFFRMNWIGKKWGKMVKLI